MDITILIEQDEDGIFVASVPEIQGCHTQGKTIPQVLERIREAIEVCLEAEEEISPMKFIGIQKIEIENGKISNDFRQKTVQTY
ncbi:MAG: type II toxin-antitoxin system HicB family antitoxin [Nanoarchaeota archaeon]|nr:type II toxin-antitoxin system HicB family antitoxin [Nanoarchaeota archaeon]MBU1104059.1 type II toxin-antitoxin system HicB family antitoxin [Nanoarchaeota archaeon]